MCAGSPSLNAPSANVASTTSPFGDRAAIDQATMRRDRQSIHAVSHGRTAAPDAACQTHTSN